MRVFRRTGFLLLALLLLAGCASTVTPSQADSRGSVAASAAPAAPAEPAPPPEPELIEARILAVGDLLMHLPLVQTSARSGDQWDFKPLFEPVRPYIEQADFAIANLETTLTGKRYPWSGYPSFNTPPEFARDIKAIGFDAVTNANNHALDYNEYGLEQTIQALDAAGLPHTGTARSPEERDRIMVVEVKPGIKMAVLAYTYATNGIPLPQPWSVNMLDKERIAADIRRARQMPGVDLVAVALHFGEEYARQPSAEQEEYVNLSLQAGADIILGDHPHVIQKIEVRQVKDEFGRDLPRAVIFSEGNFISNQVGLYQQAGLMLQIDVRKKKDVTTVDRVSFIPTWVHTYTVNGVKQYRVVAVERAMRDYEDHSDPLLTAADYQTLKAVWADTTVQAVGNPQVELDHTFKVQLLDAPPTCTACSGRWEYTGE